MNSFTDITPAIAAHIVAIHTGTIIAVGFFDSKDTLIAIIVSNGNNKLHINNSCTISNTFNYIIWCNRKEKSL